MKYANGSPQPEIGFVKDDFVPSEMNSSSADMHVFGSQIAQFTSQDFLNPPGTRGEKARSSHTDNLTIIEGPSAKMRRQVIAGPGRVELPSLELFLRWITNYIAMENRRLL